MNLLFADTETTGVDAKARIVELAWIQHDLNSGAESVFHQRYNPEIPIPRHASLIHGIYDADVRHCPTIDNTLSRLEALLPTTHAMVFHNAQFDRRMLESAFQRRGYCPTIPVICTLKMARSLGIKKLSLDDLTARFELPNHRTDKHGAYEDALMVRALYFKLKELHAHIDLF